MIFEIDGEDDEALALARYAANRGVPALHIIDGRVPHALVGELFTDQGVGTLVTRQTGPDFREGLFKALITALLTRRLILPLLELEHAATRVA